MRTSRCERTGLHLDLRSQIAGLLKRAESSQITEWTYCDARRYVLQRFSQLPRQLDLVVAARFEPAFTLVPSIDLPSDRSRNTVARAFECLCLLCQLGELTCRKFRSGA